MVSGNSWTFQCSSLLGLFRFLVTESSIELKQELYIHRLEGQGSSCWRGPASQLDNFRPTCWPQTPASGEGSMRLVSQAPAISTALINDRRSRSGCNMHQGIGMWRFGWFSLMAFQRYRTRISQNSLSRSQLSLLQQGSSQSHVHSQDEPPANASRGFTLVGVTSFTP